MKVITFTQDIDLQIGYMQFNFSLARGREYVCLDGTYHLLEQYRHLFDAHEFAFEELLYRNQDLSGKSLLFTTLGGYGDMLCAIQALNALQHRFGDAQIDIAVTPDQYYLARLFSFKGNWMPYPVGLDCVRQYDYFQSSENLHELKNHDYQADNVARMFFDLFHLQPDLSHSGFQPDGICRTHRLGSAKRKKVALQVDTQWGPNRCYPSDRIKELATLLSNQNCEIYLTGFDTALASFDHGAHVHNYVNRISNVLDLTLLLSQMDVIVSPDSLAAHLGGMLGIATLALFSVTSTAKLDHYPSLTGIQSTRPCSPCHQLFECPAGHAHCLALENDSVAPVKIVAKIEQLTNSA